MAEPPHLGDPLTPPTELIPVGGGPVPFNRQILVFEDGVPTVKDVPTVSPETIREVHAATLARRYETEDDALAVELGVAPSRFYGMTLLEVMLIRRAEEAARTGDKDIVESILDRELGKSKQTSESHIVKETYEQALERIAKVDEANRAKFAKVVTPLTDEEL